MESKLIKFSILILLAYLSLSTAAPTICNKIIAGVNFRLFSVRPVTGPVNVPQFCRVLHNFTSNAVDYSGSAVIAVKPGCVYTVSELNLCGCKSDAVDVAKTELEKLKSGATNQTQIQNLLSLIKTVNAKTRLFGILKPKIDGPKLSYDDAIQAINYALQSLTATTSIDQSISDNIASCIIETGNVIPVQDTCNSSDATTVAGIVSAATSKLAGRNIICCHDRSTNLNDCPPGYDATPCKGVQENSVIWPSSPGGSTVRLDKCKTSFSGNSVVGNLTRTCHKDADGLYSNWGSVNQCNCQSTFINAIHDRLNRKFAKNYTLEYLNTLASFLNQKWNIVPNRLDSYSALYKIINIEQRRKVVDATYDAYMNLTMCLLDTTNDFIETAQTGHDECRLDTPQIKSTRDLFYELACNFTSPGYVNQRLGSRSQFVESNQGSNAFYTEMVRDTNYGCVAVGAVVPPASINDTILYNVLGIDVIGVGSNTVAPSEVPDNTSFTNTTDNTTSFPTSLPVDVHAPILSIITIVGLSLSTLCLALLVACLLFLRLPRTRKWYIHGNLIAAVISSNVLFLFGADRRDVASNTACTAISIILHYLFTAVYTWQLAEGVHLYRLLVTIFIKKGRWWVIIYTVIGWVAPGIIVGITAGVAPAAYSGATACFLRREYIWFFLGPMAFVVAINVVIFCVIMYIIHKKTNFHNKVSNQEMNKKQVLKNDLRRAFALLPLLGICWIFIFFVQISNHPVPRYLFTVLLSFQGVFVFIFHCIFDRQIMESLGKRNFRWTEPSKYQPSSSTAKKYLNSPSLRKSTGVKHPDSMASPSSSYTDLQSISQSNNYSIAKNASIKSPPQS